MPFCSLEAYIAVSQPILNRNTEPDLYAKPTSIRNWTYILLDRNRESRGVRRPGFEPGINGCLRWSVGGRHPKPG